MRTLVVYWVFDLQFGIPTVREKVIRMFRSQADKNIK